MNWSGGSRVESASGFLPVDRDIKQISIPRDNNDRTVSSARLLPRIPRNARNSAPCVAHAADAERPRGYADILTRSRARPISPRLSNLLDSPRGWGGEGKRNQRRIRVRIASRSLRCFCASRGRGQGAGGRREGGEGTRFSPFLCEWFIERSAPTERRRRAVGKQRAIGRFSMSADFGVLPSPCPPAAPAGQRDGLTSLIGYGFSRAALDCDDFPPARGFAHRERKNEREEEKRENGAEGVCGGEGGTGEKEVVIVAESGIAIEIRGPSPSRRNDALSLVASLSCTCTHAVSLSLGRRAPRMRMRSRSRPAGIHATWMLVCSIRREEGPDREKRERVRRGGESPAERETARGR
jgi:hypothetical protein